MNREIKFRAWDTVENKMINNLQDRCGMSADLKCSNHIIEQFTGLKDKNGKEIYEGDKLEHDNHIRPMGTFEVAWDTYKMGWCLLGLGKAKSMWLRDWCKDFVEVIGTIHDGDKS